MRVGDERGVERRGVAGEVLRAAATVAAGGSAGLTEGPCGQEEAADRTDGEE